ncbi:MAG: ABC transporter permease, partial [Chloroflexi bacterium]
MKTYMDMVFKYQQANPRKTWLTIFSVALSVALVTTIFSMMDVFQRTVKIQTINETGNYHLMVKDVTAEEKAAIRSRVDVQNAGEWIAFEAGQINGENCQLAALEENFAPNMQVELAEGRYPTQADEIILEQWALEAFQPPLKIGDAVTVRFSGGQQGRFVISGLFNDFGSTKAEAAPGVVLSMAAARTVNARKMSMMLIEFKE